MKFTNTVTIHAPCAIVFSYLAQLENIPKWNDTIRDTTKLSTGPTAVGTKFKQTRTLPRQAEEFFSVTEYESVSRLTIQGDFGPFRGTMRYELTSDSPDQTTLENTADLRASDALSAVTGIIGSQVKHGVGQNLLVLKEILEK